MMFNPKFFNMTDEEFEKEAAELLGMLKSLQLIRDKSRRRWLKAEIRNQLNQLIKD